MRFTSFTRLLALGVLSYGCEHLLGISEPTERPSADTGSSGHATGGESGHGDAGERSGGRGGTGVNEAGTSGENGGGAGEIQAGTGGTTGGAGGAKGVGGSPGGESAGGAPEGGAGAVSGEGGATQHACAPDTTQCAGSTAQNCVDGQWVNEESCDDYCRDGACVHSQSCASSLLCGKSDESCCQALPVPGGTFYRDYDGIDGDSAVPLSMGMNYPATVQAFFLDKFEVTVARMRAFVHAYPNLLSTSFFDTVGLGASRQLEDDPGWPGYSLPASQDELETSLQTDCVSYTWPASEAIHLNDNLPITCVSYPIAYAFCLWDGGRLPTEVEWNYAAAGGDQQRKFAWGNEQPDADHAVYGLDYDDVPKTVGQLPAGDGRWLHSDLSGNVLEWVLDSAPEDRDQITNPSLYYPVPCVDCLHHMQTGYNGYRGGAYDNYPSYLEVVNAGAWETTGKRQSLGFRCAYDDGVENN